MSATTYRNCAHDHNGIKFARNHAARDSTLDSSGEVSDANNSETLATHDERGPDLRQKCFQITEMINDYQLPASDDELWYIVDGQFLQAIRSISTSPVGDEIEIPRVKNRHLITDDPKLSNCTIHDQLADAVSYRQGDAFDVVDPKTWKLLSESFEYDVEIPRGVFKNVKGSYKVDIQPLHVWVLGENIPHDAPGRGLELTVSRASNGRALMQRLCKLVQADLTNSSLFIISPGDKVTRQEVSDVAEGRCSLPRSWTRLGKPLESSKVAYFTIEEDSTLIVLPNKICEKFDGEEMVACRNSVFCPFLNGMTGNADSNVRMEAEISRLSCIPDVSKQSISATSRDSNRLRPGPSLEELFANYGCCGLINLGNTCFLNSAIQCLSKVLPLTSYFLAYHFFGDINTSNPMGTQGRLARAYHKFLREMWGRKDESFAPRDLKMAVGEIREEFLGYNQQDSQELIAFLLDGLHEDLNRILKKPYYEEKIEGGKNMADEKVAAASWKRHKEVNDSIIVDLFQGQYRSHLECPKCSRISLTFDPFMYLSLPIPTERKLKLMFTLFPKFSQPFCIKTELYFPGDITSQHVKESILAYLRDFTQSEKKHNEDGPLWELLRQQIREGMLETESGDFEVDNLLLFLKRPHDVTLDDSELGIFCGGSMVPFNILDPHVYVYLVPKQWVQVLEWKKGIRNDGTESELQLSSPHFANSNTKTLEKIETDASPPLIYPIPDELSRSDLEQGSAFSVGDGPDLQSRNSCGTDESSGVNISTDIKKKRLKMQNSAERRNSNFGLSESDTTLIMIFSFGRNAGEIRNFAYGHPILIPVSKTMKCCELYQRIKSIFFESSVPGLDATTVSGDPPCEEFDSYSPFAIGDSSSKRAPTEDWRILVPRSYQDHSLCPGDQNLKETGLPRDFSSKAENDRQLLPCNEEFVLDYLEPCKVRSIPVLALDISSAIDSFQRKSCKMSLTVTMHRGTHLSDCIGLFSEKEQLDENNMWYCGKCANFVQAFKKLDIWRLPKVLILHLKRFHNVSRWHRSKISTFVDYPYKESNPLDMTNFILSKGLVQQRAEEDFTPEYELLGVNCHSGGLGGGHYYAFVKVREKWYKFNDAFVDEVEEDKVLTADAYLLFYQLKTKNQ